jgi:prepilin-type processing-associated H-X9-DG protein
MYGTYLAAISPHLKLVSSLDVFDGPAGANLDLSADVYRCPSDSVAGASVRLSHLVNYSQNGHFYGGPNYRVAFRDVTDGLSNTAFVSELVRRFASRQTGDPRTQSLFTPVTSIDRRLAYREFIQSCELGLGHADSGAYEPSWLIENGILIYAHQRRPNTPKCSGLGPNFDVAEGVAYAASSWHSTSVNVLWADGHVSITNDDIDRRVWYEAGTYNSRSFSDAFE